MVVSTPSHRRRGAQPEGGAILILALLAMLVMSTVVLTLISFTGTGIRSVSDLKTVRTAEYAEQGAANVAVQSARYQYKTYATSQGQAPGLCTGTPSNVINIGSSSLKVFCSGVYDYYSPVGATRTITFSVCDSSVPTAACAGQATLTAKVVYDDFSATDVNSCNNSSTSTCGTGMNVVDWTFT
jgi:hypothetical protein